VRDLAADLPGFKWDDWRFDDSLADDASPSSELPAAGSAQSSESTRAFHGPHDAFAPHFGDPITSTVEDDLSACVETAESRESPKSSLVTWILLCFGISTLMCGGALIVGSLVNDRPGLWSVGIPIALIGQAMILIGLVLQMDVLWQESHANSATLADIDRHLGERQGTVVGHGRHSAVPPMTIGELQHHLEPLNAACDETRTDW
jgi:hypothetical protein